MLSMLLYEERGDIYGKKLWKRKRMATKKI